MQAAYSKIKKEFLKDKGKKDLYDNYKDKAYNDGMQSSVKQKHIDLLEAKLLILQKIESESIAKGDSPSTPRT